MHFDELIIELPDDEVHIPLHPRVTILGGLGDAERTELVDTVLAALAGGGAVAALRGSDATGTPLIIRGGPDGVEVRTEDGSPSPTPVPAVALTADALRQLLVMGPPAPPPRARDDEPPELREARDALDQLSDELDAATRAQDGRADVVERLEALDHQIRQARDGVARRRYAELLAQIERREHELAALSADASTVDADRALLTAGAAAHAAGEAWRAARTQLEELVDATGERIEPDRLTELAAIPPAPPEDLDELVDRVRSALARQAELEDRLQQVAVASLPEPSHPAVAELGVIEPSELARARAALVQATADLHGAQIALGGLELEGGSPASLVNEIEEAHSRAEAAERAVAAVRPRAITGIAAGAALLLLAVLVHLALAPLGIAAVATSLVMAGRPQVAARRAAAEERAVLAQAEAPSYLAFHIRRMEATVDPSVRTRVEQATAAHRAASEAWSALVGPTTTVELADVLAEETSAYHAALRDLGGAADEIELLRTELASEVRPAAEASLSGLAHACAPYGVDPAGVLDVRHELDLAIRTGHEARTQLELEAAVAAEQATAAAAREALQRAGTGSGDDLDGDLQRLDEALRRAAAREKARSEARPTCEVEEELAELRIRAEQLHRPEWDEVTASEADAPDLDELERQRAEAVAALDDGPTIDLTRLADRHAALQRRVSALEARLGGAGANGSTASQIDHHIAAFLTAASQAGPNRDPMPVVLDDVLSAAPADRRWDLLDRLLRLAEHHQLIYLTDDAFVSAWARRHADSGAVLLLEAQPVAAES